MDGQMDELFKNDDGLMEGWMDGLYLKMTMDGWMDGWINELFKMTMDGWMDFI